MKNNITNRFKYILIVLLAFATVSCHDDLEEIPFNSLSPENFLVTEQGLDKLLTAAYAGMQLHEFPIVQIHYMEEGPTDLFFETGGGQARLAGFFQDWAWGPDHNWINARYNNFWPVIRDVNVFLENVEGVGFENADKETRIAEAKFIRAFQYYWLTKFYGSVVLITSTENIDPFPSKTPLSEINTFIESELLATVPDLPLVQSEKGRITKGAALALLTKFYLNTKQWQKSADAAMDLINLGQYSLMPDYTTMFNVENEQNNSEYIFIFPQIAQNGLGNQWMALSRPPRYPAPGLANFAAQFRYYDDFVNSFDINDDRRKLFLTEYTDTNGDFIQLLGNNNSRSFKFNDPNADVATQGNDIPIIRYADILLSRAEALNEINGPTQEAIDLINAVRNRANLDDLILSDFTKESLRDHILQERAWEFYSEFRRRSDLIRHGKYIQQALDRGINAQEFRRLYPFPQAEVDANPNLEQNPGY